MKYEISEEVVNKVFLPLIDAAMRARGIDFIPLGAQAMAVLRNPINEEAPKKPENPKEPTPKNES